MGRRPLSLLLLLAACNGNSNGSNGSGGAGGSEQLACVSDSGCPDERPACVDNACRECGTDADCTTIDRPLCVEGDCWATECGPETPCSDELPVCRFGHCFSCTSASDCATGKACIAGACKSAPTVVLIQDRSGSMSACFGDGAGTGCDSDGDFVTDSDRTSRMDAARAAATALIESAPLASFGLVVAGAGSAACNPDVLEVRPGGWSNESVVSTYAESLFLLEPQGGTPTAMALEGAQRVFSGTEGDRYAVLITDGLMNCNAQHALPCTCALETCPLAGDGTVAGGESGDLALPEMCLDDERALLAVRGLRDAGVRTAVVVIGGELADYAAEALNRVAAEGGLDAGEHQAFYGASTPAELDLAFIAIRDRIFGH